MPEDPIHQPHDKLFKTGFSDPATAAGLLQWQLPTAISEQIDWEQLRLEPGTFIDSHYRHNESDLLFSAPLADGDCFIYLLFEHQITEDPTLLLRLLRYMVRIWETQLKNQTTESPRLPVIIPVVLAQNAEVWQMPSDFASLLDLPAGLHEDLRQFIPDFTFRLIQLASLPFTAIRGTPSGIMIMRTMKAERTADLLADPVWDEALLVKVPQNIFEMLIRYILNADVDKNDFDLRVSAIQQLETRSSAMSLAEQLRQEGLQRGLQRGRQEGILTTLEIRFGEVPSGLEEEIRSVCDSAALADLQRAALCCNSFEEFAASL